MTPAWAVVAAALASRTAGHASSHPQWGDVPTWLLAIFALGALTAAWLAYRKQADAASKLSDQVDLQRKQLKDQQKANRRQVHAGSQGVPQAAIDQCPRAVMRLPVSLVAAVSRAMTGEPGAAGAGGSRRRPRCQVA